MIALLAALLLVLPAAAVAADAPADTSFKPRVIGYAQFRETVRAHEGLSASFPRVRLGAEGALPWRLSYKFLVEYQAPHAGETAAGTGLRDAELRWTRAPLTLTAGQIHTPFSREYTLSPTVMETYDRSFVVEQLATRIDLGVMASVRNERDLSLTAGVFNGEGQNALANRDSTVLFVARATGRPAAPVLLGGSFAAYGGDSTRVGFDATIERGRVRVRGEWIGQHHAGFDSRDEGWYALAMVRVVGALHVVGKRAELHRPFYPPELQVQRESIAGLMADFADGHARALLDWVDRRNGRGPDKGSAVLAQLQFKL
jgi:phosphate-selective porin